MWQAPGTIEGGAFEVVALRGVFEGAALRVDLRGVFEGGL